ncbi:MGH1-like glycoside hydrolase domain-containing protein [Actinoplanes sp. CA-015351]|uniref:MGH1-like glycoside hydrolase domain-containing protein n=1 Tax=Actinoplanes sp. CA-015351 TaxID=3239897 RepID=UPI003D965C33
MHADVSAELWKSATWVLDTGRANRPARTSWDIAVTSIGFAYTDPARAWSSLRGLFEAQRPDGQVPHQTFIPGYAQRPARPVSPPLHAVAAWEVHRRSAGHGASMLRHALAELDWLYPRLSAQQEFLTDEVANPGFDAILGAADLALAQIAGALGRPSDADRHRDRAQAVTAAMVRRLWDPATRTFRSRDARTGEAGPAHTAGGLLPLLLPDLPGELAEAILDEMASERFGLPVRTGLPVPENDGTRRGPIRIDLNWLLCRGLLVHGRRAEAEQLRAATTGLVNANGHHAGYDPDTGEGIGPSSDERTAALSLDLLADRSAPAYARA